MSQNSRSRSTVVLTIIAANLVLGTIALAQDRQRQSGSGYHVVHGWPVLPEGRDLGAVSGVGVDSHNNVISLSSERTHLARLRRT